MQEEKEKIQQEAKNTLILGEISLQSNDKSISELIDLSEKMLKKGTIKKYLSGVQLQDKKRILGIG